MADKDEIRARNDIVDVIGASVALKRKGRSYLGLCPFHSEKTPSFNVNPETQTFTCFGCGAKGDVFTFVERMENMTFVEAADLLARRVGLTFARQGVDRAVASERDALFEINALALAFFRRTYGQVKVAREYVEGRRGIAPETCERFGIGYAPDAWDGLTGYLASRRHDLRAAAAAGLLHAKPDGDYYDTFRHRIMFPIYDDQERVVGFGGRAFGDETPKYLNTGETPIFAKSKLLYGLSFARKAIAAQGCVLLMEGYLDVIAAHQYGFTNAVATLGTSLTEDHARRLARLVIENPTVVLVYDADNAGIKATLRASEILEKEGIHVRVCRLPAGEDPDSLLKRPDGVALFQRAIDGAVGRVEYQLERIVATSDQTTDEGRAAMLNKIVHILATVPTRAERDVYVERMWRHHPMRARPTEAKERLHQDAEAIAQQRLGKTRPAPTPATVGAATPPAAPYRRPNEPHGRRPSPEDGKGRRPWNEPPGRPTVPPGAARPIIPVVSTTAEQRAEQELVRALATPEWRAAVLERVPTEDLVTPLARRFFQYVRDQSDRLAALNGDVLALLGECEDQAFSLAMREWLQEIAARLENEPMSRSNREGIARIDAALIEGWAERLRRYRKQQLTRELTEILAGKPELSAEDQERVDEYYRLLAELNRRSAAR